MRSQRVIPAPEYPVRFPPVMSDRLHARLQAEMRFMLFGGVEPHDKVWRQWNESGRGIRRHATRESPLAFAYVYLLGAMKPMRTAGGKVLSFSEFHLALCEKAKCLIQPDGQRIGLVAPRGSGKSFWTFFALPLWAIAHGHRNFFAGYSNTDKQARERLDDLRRELTQNELLLFDFPELEVPKKGRNNSKLIEVGSGRAFASSGIDAVTLGLRPGKYRPDFKVIDDGEPDESNYPVDGKAKRLKSIRDIVLPMNADAVVIMSGTVVMPNSIGHNLVQEALGEPTEDWVRQERFRTMYVRPILDEGSPRERSVWPEWHSLEWFKHERDTNSAQYALHYLGQPMTSGGDYWEQDDFQRDPHFPIERWIMYVDPAEVPKEGRDKTAVVVVGADRAHGPADRAVVLFAWQGHLPDVELGRKIASYKVNHPEIPLLRVYVEGYDGGSRHRTLRPLMPHGVKLVMHLPGRTGRGETGAHGKLARIENAYAHYQSRRVWHQGSLPELEALLTAFPKTHNDDLPDALAGALLKAFEG
jgi:hypothetical protein